MQRLYSRLPGIVFLLLAVSYGISAARIQYAFSSDPIGPRTFPLILAGLLAVMSVMYIVKPGDDTQGSSPIDSRILLLGALCLGCIVVFKYLGFPIAVFILCTGAARLFEASWPKSLAAGFVNTALWYLVFHSLLGVYLPVAPFWD